MPIYDYRCKVCGTVHEIEHGFHDERPTTCAACGGQLVRVFHPVGVVFKGSGFHKTDYSRSDAREPSKTAPDAKSDGAPASEKPPAKKDAAPKGEPPPKSDAGSKP